MAWALAGCDAAPVTDWTANGRIEAREFDVASKIPGRLASVLVEEGDSVEASRIVARLDTRALEAQLREADSEIRRTQSAEQYAAAILGQRRQEHSLAAKNLARSERLAVNLVIAEQRLDQDSTAAKVAVSGLDAAQALVADAAAAIAVARARRERLATELEEATLRSPGSGVVLYRLAEPGEVLPAGGRVLTLLDLDDMFLTVFLPASLASRIRVGDEARIVADGYPADTIPGVVSHIAAEAQFTPKHVETERERERMVFRIKVRARENPDRRLRPGLRGLAILRQADGSSWPAAPP